MKKSDKYLLIIFGTIIAITLVTVAIVKSVTSGYINITGLWR